MRLRALAAIPLTLALAAGGGSTAAASTKTTVKVHNPSTAQAGSWTVTARLVRGTAIKRLAGARADRRRGVVTLTPKVPLTALNTRKIVITISGRKRPRGWKAEGRACSANGATVTCELADHHYLFAPYADVSLGTPPDLDALLHEGNVRAVSLGFVTARGGTDCVPAWGGYAEYPASGANAYQGRQVRDYTSALGEAIPSFGGQAGTELAEVCGSDQELANAYKSVIDAYGAHRVDFDVEGAQAGSGHAEAGARRARAIAMLQDQTADAGRPLVVSYTLSATPTGLDDDALAVLRGAIDEGAFITTVNGMAMDYGDAVGPGVMGDRAIAVGDGMKKQLRRVFPDRTHREVVDAVGVTVMIGRNDDAGEVTSLDDARRLAAYAAKKGLGMLSMWSVSRDRKCAGSESTTRAEDTCSGVRQRPWDFSHALGAFSG